MDKKTLIIQTAIRLFAEKGYAFTTVDEIAKACGMTKPSLYKYFPGKEDLLLEAMAMLSEELEGRVHQLYRKAGLSKSDRIIELIVIFLEYIFNHRTYMVLFIEPLMPIYENEDIQNAFMVIERKLFMWFQDSIIDLCGEEVEGYATDLTFVASSVLLDYIRVVGPHLSHEHCYRLATYVEHLIGVLVEGWKIRKPEMPLLFETPSWVMNCRSEEMTPVLRSRQLQKSFRNMELIVKDHESLKEEEKEDYLEAIGKLRTELNDSLTESVVFKALLIYLEQLEDLREECAKLRAFLFEPDGQPLSS